jgi:hypothetical protein
MEIHENRRTVMQQIVDGFVRIPVFFMTCFILCTSGGCGGGGSGDEDAGTDADEDRDAVDVDVDADADADGQDDGAPGDDGTVEEDAAVEDVYEDVIPPNALRVEKDGEDTGDCRTAPCLTLAYAGTQMGSGDVLMVGDGTYDEAIDNDVFPIGTAGSFTVIRAVHDGRVIITGGLSLYRNGDFYLQFEGLRFDSRDTKGVAGGNVRFYRTSFSGGPAAGNTVNWGVGTNDFQPGAWDILCEDCLFYGLGGRYSALVYRAENVILRRAVARKDGGWGLGGPDETEFEPEGVIIFYESSNSTCEQCVVFDSLKLSDSSAEGLGALILNSHDEALHHDVQVTGSLVVNNVFKGIALEGNGSVHNALFADTYAVANESNGVTLNLHAVTAAFERCAVIDNAGDGIANYGSADVTITDCVIRDNAGEQLRGVTGETAGSGPNALDLSAFDSARIREEFCAGVDRGFCAGSGTFQEYLQGFMSR